MLVYFKKLFILYSIFFVSKIYNAGINKVLKGADPKNIAESALKAAGLSSIIDIQKNLTELQKAVTKAKITDLKIQLTAIKNKKNDKERSLAAQKAAADFETLVPLITLLFSNEQSSKGVIISLVNSLGQQDIAKMLSQFASIVTGLSKIATQLLNPSTSLSIVTQSNKQKTNKQKKSNDEEFFALDELEGDQKMDVAMDDITKSKKLRKGSI